MRVVRRGNDWSRVIVVPKVAVACVAKVWAATNVVHTFTPVDCFSFLAVGTHTQMGAANTGMSPGQLNYQARVNKPTPFSFEVCATALDQVGTFTSSYMNVMRAGART